jgi:hypothetical protein
MRVKHNITKVIFTKKKCIHHLCRKHTVPGTYLTEEKELLLDRYRNLGSDLSIPSFLLGFPYRYLPKLTIEVRNADPDPQYFGELVQTRRIVKIQVP